MAHVNVCRVFPTIVNFSIFKAPLCGVKDHLFTFCGSSLSLIIHLSRLFVALGRSYFFFFACMIFLLMDSISLPPHPPPLRSLSPVNISVSLSLLPAPNSRLSGRFIDIFPASLLLPNAHVNVRRLIRCTGGLEFHFDSLLALLLFLWVIHPSFLCPESQTSPPFTHTQKPCGLI